jgi:hypothetical protein
VFCPNAARVLFLASLLGSSWDVETDACGSIEEKATRINAVVNKQAIILFFPNLKYIFSLLPNISEPVQDEGSEPRVYVSHNINNLCKKHINGFLSD